jgi:hypothetical protein
MNAQNEDVLQGQIDHDLAARVKRCEQKFAAIVSYFNYISNYQANGGLSPELAVLMGMLDDGVGAQEHYLSRAVK